MLAGVTNSSIATLLAARASRGPVGATPIAAATRAGTPSAAPRVDPVSLSGEAGALANVGGAVDQLSRASNTLALAGATLDNITKLLDRVHATLDDAAANDATKQGALDTAIGQVNRAAESARFSGQRLFDGAWTVAVPGATIALPVVSAQTLGVDVNGGNSLASLAGGRSNAIAVGGGTQATAIVDRAAEQVGVARDRIEQFQRDRLDPALSAIQSTLQVDTAGASSVPDRARTTALLTRAQAVVRPEAVIAAAGPTNSQNVFALVA